MRNIWLIPDREQDGLTRSIEDERISSLNELIDLKLLPPVLVLGIPEEISRAHSNGKFIYAQFVTLKNLDRVFCLSAPAGTDRSGRMVFITNLQILTPTEEPAIPPKRPSNFPTDLNPWVEQFSNTKSSEYEPVYKMLEACRHNAWKKSFSSERLQKSKFMPDWMPQKKRRNFPLDSLSIVLISLLMMFALAVLIKFMA